MRSFEKQRSLALQARTAAIVGALLGVGIGFAASGIAAAVGYAVALGAAGFGAAWAIGKYVLWHDEQQRLRTLRRLPFRAGLTIDENADRVSMFVKDEKAIIYIRQTEDAWLEIGVSTRRRHGKSFEMTTIMSTEAALARNINTHLVGWEALQCRVPGVKLERFAERGKADYVAALGLEAAAPVAEPPAIQQRGAQPA